MIRLRQKTRLEKLFSGEFAFEIVIALGALASGVVTGVRLSRSSPPDPWLAAFSFASASAVCVCLLIRAVYRQRRSQGIRELHALDGVLYALHAIITAQLTTNSDGTVRICVFVPGLDEDTVHQITDYVGVDNRTGRGRNLSSRCGVVGTAVRRGRAQYDKLPRDVSAAEHLVTKYGFSREEAATMKLDRRAWAAIPVGDEDNVVAVLYLDSNQPDFLGRSRKSVQRKVLEAATIGVARFIART